MIRMDLKEYQCNDVSSSCGGIELGCASGPVIVNNLESVGGIKITPKMLETDQKLLKSKPSVPQQMQRSIIKSRRMQICAVASCEERSDQLVFATSAVLTYFGFKNRLAIVKVCSKCVAKAEKFQKESIDAIKNGKCMFLIQPEPQLTDAIPETVDLADDDDNKDSSPTIGSTRRRTSDQEDEVEVDFKRDDVGQIVNDILSAVNFDAQLKMSSQIVLQEATELEKEFKENDAKAEAIGVTLTEAMQKLSKLYNDQSARVIIHEVDIDADGLTRRRNMPGIKGQGPVFASSAALAKAAQRKIEIKAKQETLQDAALSQSGIKPSENIIERKPGPASKTAYYEAVDATRKGPFDMPIKKPVALKPKIKLLKTPPTIPRIKPQIGHIVYAMNKNLLNFWLQGEVEEIVTNPETNQDEFLIHYEPTKDGKPTGGEEGDGTKRQRRQLSLKELALNAPCPFVLPVGTRVIAKFKDEFTTDPTCDGYYFAGIIADHIKPHCVPRYLIFFDDGYAQYVSPDEVLLICGSSKESWNDVYPDSYNFVKEYITKFPDVPMVRLHVGALVPTEWNGRWVVARVMEVDASLAKVQFEDDARIEWIYRGSPRFRPVYKVWEKTPKQSSNIPRHDSSQFKNRNQSVVVYTAPNESNDKRTARKSTAPSPPSRIEYKNDKENSGEVKHFNVMDVDQCIEFHGTMTKIILPIDTPKPKEYKPHDCSSNCLTKYVELKEWKSTSPLAIPLFCGWAREVGRHPRSVVFYRAPCGVRLRNHEELESYMGQTGCNFSLDQFCFDIEVDCLNQFSPARKITMVKDISYGKETIPVQLWNSLDHDTLPYMDYTPNRTSGPGVNFDPDTQHDFLSCCDCTDNCQDKSKCACWKLTMGGIAFTKLSNQDGLPIQGYEHKRLQNHIVSGIYECNSRCHCKKSCSNRVVQNGVQWPLQVFKTAKKGWGIRALFDIPSGSFICIYSGEILTDQMANENTAGDEYLAELDYIECNEGVKSEYESDVTDIEESDSDNESMTSSSKRCRESDEQMDIDSQSDSDSVSSTKPGETGRRVAARKTNGQKKRGILFEFDTGTITAHSTKSSRKKKRCRVKMRKYFGDDDDCYIMDAKIKGNIGRYLNHSCSPNIFVQNVFVDSHDLRFPVVAFFTNQFIKAGTELTWDYHYQIGSVPGKVLFCYCNTIRCRGRLL